MLEIIPNWHPIAVHFTIALACVSGLLYISWYLLARRKPDHPLLFSAHLNLWLGVVAATFTVAAGFVAYNSVTHDEISHLAMIDHRNWALGSSAGLLVWCGWSVLLFRKRNSPGLLFLVPLILTLGLIMVTGYKGAELVYRHGIGVMALPDVASHEGDTHQHSSDAATQAMEHHQATRDSPSMIESSSNLPESHASNESPPTDHDHSDHEH